MKCTNCRITAIQDEEIEHAVEITSNSLQRVEEGARRVLHHLLVGLDSMLNEDLRRKCYIDFADTSTSSITKESSSHPPVKQITTTKNNEPSPSKLNNRYHHNNPDDTHWRIHLSLPPNEFKGKIGMRLILFKFHS